MLPTHVESMVRAKAASNYWREADTRVVLAAMERKHPDPGLLDFERKRGVGGSAWTGSAVKHPDPGLLDFERKRGVGGSAWTGSGHSCAKRLLDVRIKRRLKPESLEHHNVVAPFHHGSL